MQIQFRPRPSLSPKNHATAGAMALWGAIVLLSVALLLSVWPGADASVRVPVSSTILPASGKLCLMTFNIRHAKGLDGQVRLSAIRDQIQQAQADFAALQEVDRFQWRSGLQDQARVLAKQLGMSYAYAPALRNGLSEYGIALLSRYPLINIQIYPLAGVREPRAVLAAEAVVKLQDGEQKRLTIVTTHLGVANADRVRQMPELIRIVQSLPAPVVLMGDLNTAPNDPLMKELETVLHKVSLQAPLHSTLIRGGEIDHIFTSLNPSVTTGAWTEPTRVSDHVPVLHEISFP